MASSLNVRQLTGRLGNLLRRAPEARPEPQNEVIDTGDFHIDLQAHQVTVRGRQIELTSEEFDMLVFLAGHPRRVVTPSTQLNTRWGEHEVRQTQFLRVLTALRQKIEAAAGRAGYIRTEPWVFYRFDTSR
ncbi:MAG TPA: winged helix-turn-helix domain-containing protein [Terriglobales bacterium]|jgi:two-component system KDP operon response regulator KdpE|nr:winged helix-turn-helix domain-containing protein [Terriglobales bacterium]